MVNLKYLDIIVSITNIRTNMAEMTVLMYRELLR